MSQNTEQPSIQQVYADTMLNTIADQRNAAQNQVAALTGQVRVLEAQLQELQGSQQGQQPETIQKPDGDTLPDPAQPTPQPPAQPGVEVIEPQPLA